MVGPAKEEEHLPFEHLQTTVPEGLRTTVEERNASQFFYAHAPQIQDQAKIEFFI